MSVGTLTIALVPGYGDRPVRAIVGAGRLCQGFLAGVELGGVSVYLSEISNPGPRFLRSWQSGSQQVAVVFRGCSARAVESDAAPSSWMPGAGVFR